jgi:hypothetical protein
MSNHLTAGIDNYKSKPAPLGRPGIGVHRAMTSEEPVEHIDPLPRERRYPSAEPLYPAGVDPPELLY